jgi:hypothetical protein
VSFAKKTKKIAKQNNQKINIAREKKSKIPWLKNLKD